MSFCCSPSEEPTVAGRVLLVQGCLGSNPVRSAKIKRQVVTPSVTPTKPGEIPAQRLNATEKAATVGYSAGHASNVADSMEQQTGGGVQ
jgi:hypothetical protein